MASDKYLLDAEASVRLLWPALQKGDVELLQKLMKLIAKHAIRVDESFPHLTCL